MPKYDAFLSYASRASKDEATALQQGLQRFGKKWNELMALRVFRDDAALSASPTLWRDIEAGLQESEWFILLLSPASAGSSWVEKEVSWWLENRSMDRMLLVHDEGTYRLVNHVFTEDTDCVPEVLRNHLGCQVEGDEAPDEPRITDFTWFDAPDSLRENDPRYWDVIADLSCAIQGKSKLEVHGSHVAERRKVRNLARGAIVSLSILLIAAVVAAFLAIRSNEIANAELVSRIASDLSSRAILLRNEAPRIAALSALAAHSIKPDTASARAMGSVAEANRGVRQSMKVFNSAITAVASERLWTLASTGDNKAALIRWVDREIVAQIEFPKEVERLTEFSTPSEHRFVASLKGGDIRMISIDDSGDYVLSEMGQLPEGEQLVWSGVLPMQRARGYAAVTNKGTIQTWTQEGVSAGVSSTAKICQTDRGAEITAATNDNRFLIVSSKLYLWCSAGEDSALLVVDMEDKSSDVEVIRGPSFFRARSLAYTDNGILVGSGNGLHLMSEFGEFSNSYAGVTSSVEKLATDGYSVLVGTQGNTYVFEDTSRPIAEKRGAHATAISHTTERGFFVGYGDGMVVETQDQWAHSDDEFYRFASDFTLTPDGGLMAIARDEKLMQRIEVDFKSGSEIGAFEEFVIPEGVRLEQIVSRGNTVVGVGIVDNGNIQLVSWGLDDRQLQATRPLEVALGAMAVSPSGTVVAVSDEESSSMSFFSLPDLNPLRTVTLDKLPTQFGFMGTNEEVIGLESPGSPEASLVRIGSDSVVSGHAQPGAYLLAVSPDGETYATMTGAVVATYSKEGVLTASASIDRFVTDMSWSNQGKALALVAGGSSVTLLDGETLAMVGPDVRRGDGHQIERVLLGEEMDESGRVGTFTLYTSNTPAYGVGSLEKHVVDQENIREQLCRIAGSSFSPEEWYGAVSGLIPFQDLCADVPLTYPSSEEILPTTTQPMNDPNCGPPDDLIIKYTEHPEGKVVRRSCKEDDGWFVYEADTYFFDNPNQMGRGMGLMRLEEGEWKHYFFLERRYCNQLVWLNKDLQPEGLPLWVQDEFDCRDVIEEFPNGFEEP